MVSNLMASTNLLNTLSDWVEKADYEGYVGVTYLFHQMTRQVIVQWTGEGIEENTKSEVERHLSKLFTEKKIKDEPVVEVEASYDDEPAVDEKAEDVHSEQSNAHQLSPDISRVNSSSKEVEQYVGSSSVEDGDVCTLSAQYNGSKSPKRQRNAITSVQLISADSQEEISTMVSRSVANGNSCSMCQYNAANTDDVTKHIRQHFTKIFCECGFRSFSRNVVVRHIRDYQHSSTIYEVDRISYPVWAEQVGLENPPPYNKPRLAQSDYGDVSIATSIATSSDVASLAAIENEKKTTAFSIMSSLNNRRNTLVLNTHVPIPTSSSDPSAREESQTKKCRRKQLNPLKVVIPKRIRFADTIQRMSEDSWLKIRSAIAKSKMDGNVCPICRRKAVTSSGIIRHIRQHFTKTFCQCGFKSFCRDIVVKHLRRLDHSPTIYEVDEVSYLHWAAEVGLENPPPFGKHVFGKSYNKGQTWTKRHSMSSAATPSTAPLHDNSSPTVNLHYTGSPSASTVNGVTGSHNNTELCDNMSKQNDEVAEIPCIDITDYVTGIAYDTEPMDSEQCLEVCTTGKNLTYDAGPYSTFSSDLNCQQSTSEQSNVHRRKRGSKTWRWIAENTKQRIDGFVSESELNGFVCPVCTREALSLSGIKKHIRQHFIKIFCQCGFKSFCRDSVVKHLRRLKHPPTVYEVDEASYSDWAEYIGLQDAPPFGEHVFGKSYKRFKAIDKLIKDEPSCKTESAALTLTETFSFPVLENGHSLTLSDNHSSTSTTGGEGHIKEELPSIFSDELLDTTSTSEALIGTSLNGDASLEDQCTVKADLSLAGEHHLLSDRDNSLISQTQSSLSKCTRKSGDNSNSPRFQRTFPVQWISEDCLLKLKNAITLSKDGNVCPICQREAVTLSGIKRHIRQHFTKIFCECGFKSFCRDSVIRHLRRLNHSSTIHEVDEASYPKWAEHVGLENPPPFGEHLFR